MIAALRDQRHAMSERCEERCRRRAGRNHDRICSDRFPARKRCDRPAAFLPPESTDTLDSTRAAELLEILLQPVRQRIDILDLTAAFESHAACERRRDQRLNPGKLLR